MWMGVMPRFKLTIEYDGRPFVGWQVQRIGVTVQGVLTVAVTVIDGGLKVRDSLIEQVL